MIFGKHCIRSNSNTQSDIALSSGESEFYGAVKAASVGLGAVAMAADVGIRVELELRMDSTAGKAISERQGLGRTRRIAARFLWIQQRVARKDLSIVEWPGKDNPARHCRRLPLFEICLPCGACMLRVGVHMHYRCK